MLNKIDLLEDLSKNEEINKNFEKFIIGVTGSLGDNKFYTVTTIKVEDLERLLYRSYLEGVYFEKENYRKLLEINYEKHYNS